MNSVNQTAEKQRKQRRRRDFTFQSSMTLVAVIFVLLAFIPIFLMLFLSLKNQAQFYGNLWEIPNPPQWSNYNTAWNQLIGNMLNSVITVAVGTLLIVVL